MPIYGTDNRSVGIYHIYAASRVAFIFVVAMCFAQVVSAQHIHELEDIDQTCVICRFSDTQDILISTSVETDRTLQFYEQHAEHDFRVRTKASFGYEARAPPFSSSE